jgi:2'-5' RNA ligase
MPASDRRRVFFALWPRPAVAASLAASAQMAHALCGGRIMRQDTLHLTLAFIGDVPAVRIDGLLEAASRVTGDAFSLSLDRLGCWRHNRIVWAGASEPPPQLIALVGQLNERLADAGFPLEARDFAAHLTLLRKARCVALPAFETIAWPVAEFVLAESQLAASGAAYTLIGRWPLATASGYHDNGMN